MPEVDSDSDEVAEGDETAERKDAVEGNDDAEDDDEDYEDVFGKANGTSSQPMQTLQLNTRLSNKSWVGLLTHLVIVAQADLPV